MPNDQGSFGAHGIETAGKPAVGALGEVLRILFDADVADEGNWSRYGVSRVYSQQCGYVLADTQSFRDKMRGVVVVMKEMETDPDAGKVK